MVRAKSASHIIRVQKLLVFVAIVLFIVKVIAWYVTSSVAVLTDALESTVNVVAGIVGLYSVILSSKPKDKEHPYGHGKVEFLSSAVEGVLICLAGLIIVYESLDNLIHPHVLRQLDLGMLLLACTAIVNYIVGFYCISHGKKHSSPVLIAGGEHLKSDTYTTLGILAGVLLIYLTGLVWLDTLAALFFAGLIIFTGYKIVRRSISGIMDETDMEIIDEIIAVLNEHRIKEWIDIHNMRVINYAGFYHIDCHLTVPYYVNVNEAHAILDKLTGLLETHFDNRIEFFVHVDGCISEQCSICAISDCKERKSPFKGLVHWEQSNVLLNSKHVDSP